MKHKVGDTVKITKELYKHEYPIGHEVKIVAFHDNVDGKGARGYLGEKHCIYDWCFTDEECEAIEPVSNAKPIGNVNSPDQSQIYAMGIKDGIDMAQGIVLMTWVDMGIEKDVNKFYHEVKRRLEEKAKEY